MTIKTGYDHGVFSWVDLVAHDRDAATAFYSELFGWTAVPVDAEGPPYAMLKLGEHFVAGAGQMNDEMKAQGVPPMWNSYINVDDVKAITERAASLGAEVSAPPMQVMEAGWLSFIKDPTGAHVGFWQKGQHFGAGLVNAPSSFCWNELATRDLDEAKAFYGDLLGWTFEAQEDTPTPYFVCKVDGNPNGGLMQMNEEWDGIPPVWIVYFAVEDAAATAARVTELGGKINVEPFDTPVGKISVVADPQGAVFSVIALSDPPA